MAFPWLARLTSKSCWARVLNFDKLTLTANGVTGFRSFAEFERSLPARGSSAAAPRWAIEVDG